MSFRENTYILRQIRMPFLRLWMVQIRHVLWDRWRYGQTRAVLRNRARTYYVCSVYCKAVPIQSIAHAHHVRFIGYVHG